MSYCEIFFVSLEKEVKPKVKYLAIFRHKDKYPIKTMCSFFNVSRSGYYDFVKRMDNISYIHTNQGVLYLSIIRDLHDDSIVSYKTSTQQTFNLVLNTIKLAVKKETVTTELQLHSDQGFQYTSGGYFNLTKEYDITPSMSRRGNCYDNAMAENFFSILKTECIYRHKPNFFEEANKMIDDFIWFYNNERIQLKTKLTPDEKRCQSIKI